MTSVLERRLTWGDALVLAVHRSKVGLNPLVEAIRGQVGAWIGTRPTFAKLYDVRDIERLDETEKFRAWLLLTALGFNPDDWGVKQTVVPPAYDVRRLRRALSGLVRHTGLEPVTRWFEVSGNTVAWPVDLAA